MLEKLNSLKPLQGWYAVVGEQPMLARELNFNDFNEKRFIRHAEFYTEQASYAITVHSGQWNLLEYLTDQSQETEPEASKFYALPRKLLVYPRLIDQSEMAKNVTKYVNYWSVLEDKGSGEFVPRAQLFKGFSEG